ncbi:TonB-dependent siderophore receptor [Pseudoalteromonas sp. 20-92]|uniref:TonB-dependent receptor n=1 Tax=unclassified Pseudoalteromonas TaxID=194690 RepID=UPI00023153E7|nr:MULTISPECIES: TonB-dependent siderophore receptor [unclassified Pseudoalteromonas]MDQ2044659.1 TonB-dependent siderophore receptor [Pseudoalteromonas sp. 20-92]GAA78596.1 iron complex outermembrane recepter protein [Pseudoalteromonas sp. BSi20495]
MSKPSNKGNTYAKPIAAVVTATLSTWASAQDVQELSVTKAQTKTESSYVVEKSTSHKYTQPLLDTAKTVTVINQAVMKDRNVDSLQDALRNVSGISLAAGEGGSPTGDSMSIRGFSAASDIFVDGIRDVAGYTRDVYNIEAVEVAKGPGSAVSGRGATGGSVNLETKKAKLDNFNDVSLRLGTENDYRGRLDTNIQVNETSALRVNLLSDSGDVAGRDYVENEKNAIAVALATGLGTNSRFDLNFEYQRQDNLPDYGIAWVRSDTPVAELVGNEYAPPPVDFDNFYGNVYRDYEDIEAYSTTARHEYDFSKNTTLRTQVRLGKVKRESVTTAPRFFSVTTDTDITFADEKTRDTENSLAALQVDLIGNYEFAGFTHDVVVGIELANETFTRHNFVATTADNLIEDGIRNDLYNPDATIAFTGVYGRNGTSIEAKAKNQAIYAFDTVTLNKQWEVTGGIRFDSFTTDYHYDYANPSALISTSDDLFSWNAAVVYKPTENGSIYFGAGNSFNPSAEGITVSTRGNTADLDPEESNSYELGTKWNLMDGRLQTNAALFRTEKTNARTDDPFAEDTRADLLNGEQRVQGLELSATGLITKEWTVIASYTYQDSEVTKASGDDIIQIGNELPRTPKNSASIWTTYEISEQLSFGAGMQYLGERYSSSSSTRARAPSYTIFDLMVAYDVSKDLSLQLNAENLGDKDYVNQLGGGHFVPGEGRKFSLTASYSF